MNNGNYDFSQFLEKMSYQDYQSKCIEGNNLKKHSLLELAKMTGFSYKDLKSRYDKGLDLLLAVVRAFDLFERKRSITLCPDCGKIISRKEKCNHEKDYYDLFDQNLDNLEYLGFVSFERFVILDTFEPEILSILLNRGGKKPNLQKKNC